MNARRIVRRGNYVAAAIALVIVIIMLVSGCTGSQKVTVTGKYQDISGEYLICVYPNCGGSKYVVTKAEYDEASVGQSYTITCTTFQRDCKVTQP